MEEYAKTNEEKSRTINSDSVGFRQPPISDILQAYRNGTLGRSPIQRESIEDDDLIQTKTSDQAPVSAILQQYSEKRQRYASEEDEEMLQGKFETAQRQEKTNNTGLPDNLKSGVENLSGYSLDDVKVHYNSDKPAQLNALAYAQGTDIHVAPGQEKHLPHEAWHVVQQKQGRVQPTIQLQGININSDNRLEKEADEMGQKSVQQRGDKHINEESISSVGNLQKIAMAKQDPEDVISKGKRKLGKDIGVLRPYLGEYEKNLCFIYGLISGFTLNGIISSLQTINSKRNPILQKNISHEVQKVIKLDQNYNAYLGSERLKFTEGRTAELKGLAGELSICARLISAGNIVNGLGNVYKIPDTKNEQEVDLTVIHEGKLFFIEIAASVSRLRDKCSGGGQMEGYKKLVEKIPNTTFAYTSPDLKLTDVSAELIKKMKDVGAWLIIGDFFYSPDNLQQIESETRTFSKERKTSKGTGKAKGRMEQELKSYTGRSVDDILASLEGSYEEDYEEEDYEEVM